MSRSLEYTLLLVSHSIEHKKIAQTMATSIHIQMAHTLSPRDALEYLMDTSIDILLLDLSIGAKESFNFLQNVTSDYDNSNTPILLLAPLEVIQEASETYKDFNILGILNQAHWQTQAYKLIQHLHAMQVRLHSLQNTLIESESRGTIDPLTGAYNRYGCEDIFHSLRARYKAYTEPFCGILIDIDHFKEMNDLHGYATGDEVLIDFAKTIIHSIRQDDSLIRLGGEKFMLFVSNVSEDIAIHNAEKLRLKIQNALHGTLHLSITASFGVASYIYGEAMKDFIQRADTCLHEAKKAGRNQVAYEGKSEL